MFKVGTHVTLLIFIIFMSQIIVADQTQPFPKQLAAAAEKRTEKRIRYDGRYFKIKYPGGDIPEHLGVCTDVVIRSYRSLGIDLQQLVHEDMQQNFHLYPKFWNLTNPDPNIDHRRVPNLQVFFTRHGKSLSISDNPKDYKPGDIVTWNIATTWRKIIKRKGNIPHIGIVSNQLSKNKQRPLIVHNIGLGPQLEDILFDYQITGVYRFHGTNAKPNE